MTPSNSLFKITSLGIGLIILGVSVSPTFADEAPITEPKPLEVSTGTVSDLQGLDLTINILTSNPSFSTLELQSFYDTQASSYTIQSQKFNLTLEPSDNTLGDIQRTTRRLPFAQFQ